MEVIKVSSQNLSMKIVGVYEHTAYIIYFDTSLEFKLTVY